MCKKINLFLVTPPTSFDNWTFSFHFGGKHTCYGNSEGPSATQRLSSNLSLDAGVHQGLGQLDCKFFQWRLLRSVALAAYRRLEQWTEEISFSWPFYRSLVESLKDKRWNYLFPVMGVKCPPCWRGEAKNLHRNQSGRCLGSWGWVSQLLSLPRCCVVSPGAQLAPLPRVRIKHRTGMSAARESACRLGARGFCLCLLWTPIIGWFAQNTALPALFNAYPP